MSAGSRVGLFEIRRSDREYRVAGAVRVIDRSVKISEKIENRDTHAKHMKSIESINNVSLYVRKIPVGIV